jgi:SAM-dependent methyltransferase
VAEAGIPKRISWAVRSLPLTGDASVLEIGCGRGVALRMICDRLSTGRMVGVDRSTTAIAAARSRNGEYIAAGRLRLIESDLAAAPFDDTFDVAFAVNVNVFWLQPKRELETLRRILNRGGRLCLFYEPPARSKAAQIIAQCTASLARHDFRVLDAGTAELRPNTGAYIFAAAP